MSEKKIESFKFGLKDLDSFPGKNKIDEIFERIAKDIKEREDEVMAKEFTQIIGKLLRENGVVPHIVKIENMECTLYSVEKHYGVSIDELDFSEHDKVFEDKITEQKNEISILKGQIDNYRAWERKLFDENKVLKQRIAELESKEISELPFDPLECANYLINATYERETNGIERAFHNLPKKVNSDRYTVDELEQIAEHLLVYCKHNKESEDSWKGIDKE